MPVEPDNGASIRNRHGKVFVLDFPSGLLQNYVELPWPLR
jgi:hypothetical protein